MSLMRAGCLGLISPLWLTFASPLPAQQMGSVRGWVETWDGERLPSVEVRVTAVGGTQTSQSGEFAISLPSSFRPGHPITLNVEEEGKTWIVASPFGGRTFVPQPGFPLEVRVLLKGDPRFLTDSNIVRRIVEEVTSRLVPKTQQPAQPDVFLLQIAGQLGFELDELKTAITDWKERVQEPYLKGLAALYDERYAEASTYIQQSDRNE